MPSEQVLQQKAKEVEEIAQLINEHKVLAIASLQKVRAAQLQ
jgi:ribosomal protein L10